MLNIFCFCKVVMPMCSQRGFYGCIINFKYLLVCIKRTQAAISGRYFIFLSCFTSRDNLLSCDKKYNLKNYDELIVYSILYLN